MENRCAVWNDRQEDGCREGHCTPGARAPRLAHRPDGALEGAATAGVSTTLSVGFS